MANYECTYRTNYFCVTDEEKYKKLISKISGDYFEDFTEDDTPDLHGFGGYGCWSFVSELTLSEWLEEHAAEEKPKRIYKETAEGTGDLEIISESDDVGKWYVYEAVEKDDAFEIKIDEYPDDDGCGNCDKFYEELQKILPDDEAVILMESGNENLRYVTGTATVITSKEVRFLDMSHIAIETASKMLGKEFETQLDY